MKATWLSSVLRDAGLTVIEDPGWITRGREMAAVHGVVIHDTVTTTAWTTERVVALLRDGRPDLAGPLAQLGLGRTGVLYLVAAGRSNHNGYGEWGNDSIGIEVFCAGGLAGQEEPMNAVQREVSARAAAAILSYVRYDESRCKGHKETDPQRKIDPWGTDMNALRAQVAHHLAGAPAPQPEEIEMLLIYAPQGAYLLSGGKLAHIADPTQLEALAAAGIRSAGVSAAQMDKFRVDFGGTDA